MVDSSAGNVPCHNAISILWMGLAVAIEPMTANGSLGSRCDAEMSHVRCKLRVAESLLSLTHRWKVGSVVFILPRCSAGS